MQIVSIVLLVLGAAVVYGAKLINKYMKLDDKMKVPEGYTFATPEEERTYLEQKALAAIKVFGLIFVIPGIILIFIYFR